MEKKKDQIDNEGGAVSNGAPNSVKRGNLILYLIGGVVLVVLVAILIAIL